MDGKRRVAKAAASQVCRQWPRVAPKERSATLFITRSRQYHNCAHSNFSLADGWMCCGKDFIRLAVARLLIHASPATGLRNGSATAAQRTRTHESPISSWLLQHP